jgi:hypothetical protein
MAEIRLVNKPESFHTPPLHGKLYPLEICLVADNAIDLAVRIYRYRPGAHELVAWLPGGKSEEIVV